MGTVRVLVGTRKGAFILSSDGARKDWNIDGPHFGGWEVYHIKGSTINPDRLYAAQATGWFGQLVQQSDDGGKSWNPVSNEFTFEGAVGTHLDFDDNPRPWAFKRVWHLEPSLSDPETVFAGIEDAALFRSTDGGRSWQELAGLRNHPSSSGWHPGAGGLCLHTILMDAGDPNRMIVAISVAGAFRTLDGGTSWEPINKGLHSDYMPEPEAEVGHCVHRLAMHPSYPDALFMQSHRNIMRSDNGGDSWVNVSGNLPSDFGFPISVHAHEPETIYVVPMKGDSEHYPDEGHLRVYRSRTGGNEWEPLSSGLPQKDCYVNVLRDAMDVDTLDDCGIYFGTSGGAVYVSPDGGDHWSSIVENLPPVMSVEVQTLP